MRPASRSPPFLLIGLLVALCILAFNYWNLSSKNGELSRQLESVQVDFRAVSDKHLTVEKRAADLAAQLSETSSRVTGLQKTCGAKDTTIQELIGQMEALKKDHETATKGLKECQTQLEALRQEKQNVDNALQQAKVELEVERQKAAPTCDKNSCKDPIREVIAAVTKGVGKSPIINALKQANIDLSQVASDLLELKEGEQLAGGQQEQPLQPQQEAAQPAGADQQQHQQPQQVVGQDPNVVQMQQMVGVGQFGQHAGGFGGGVGDRGKSLIVEQQQYQVQPPFNDMQNPANPNRFPSTNELIQNPNAANNFNEANNGANNNFNYINNPAKRPSDSTGNHQEIVAQNLPQQPVVSEDNSNNLAQEDVNGADVPEDEMDKQAAANHGAEDNLGDGHLQQQLQDLSKNDGDAAPVVGDFDGKDNGIPITDNDGVGDQDREEEGKDDLEDYERHREEDNNVEGDGQ